MKKDTKTELLEKGMAIIVEKGFNNTGIAEILQAVGVPKGSFYHYFASKEDFGIKMIDYFTESYFAELDEYLGNHTLSPLNRLLAKLYVNMDRLRASNYAGGCLFGNLAQELSSQSEVFRNRLYQAFESWMERITRIMDEGKEVGEVPLNLNSRELAEFYVNSIEGALIRCKLLKSDQPIEVFKKMFYQEICKVKEVQPI